MYCPRCSQQVPDEGLRFCSRCGLRLDGVALLLANDGVIEQLGVGQDQPGPSSKKKGIRLGAKLMFLSGVLAPIFFGLCIVADDPAPLGVPFVVFLAGLAFMLYSRWFVDDASSLEQRLPRRVGGTAAPKPIYLPPQSEGVTINAPRATTSELAQQPSVTERTTELFDDQ